ncbi:expressed unknown protein [Seminavis robusta]|uniref:Uncharacterized protein n=1 Tax=Seminavis robusta TaxID=568900 RepID=A0A9N8HBC3_9STRA|nr:expressed unknown protein [Seminavis robusta]|eukprot:Sro271_g104650.1 n/a (489) ;mRNA; r:62657-64123
MNKYNVRAIRKGLDDCVRNRAWKKLSASVTALIRDPNLLEAVVLTTSKLASGSFLHGLVKQDHHENVLSLATMVARAAPHALTVQDSLLQTPVHIAIARNQPPEMVDTFLRILSGHDDNKSLYQVLAAQDKLGETALIKAAKGDDSSQYIPVLLRYMVQKSLGSLLLIQDKRKQRTALSYAVSNELHNAYKYPQYVPPAELRLLLIATYFAVVQKHEQGNICDHEWTSFQQELLDNSNNALDTSSTTTTTTSSDMVEQLTVRALVTCSHLLGKYAVKLLDFLMENDTYRQWILSQEVDQHGNYMVHLIASNFHVDGNDATGNTTTTKALLLDQLQQRKGEFSEAVCHPNDDGNMPLHLAIATGQFDLVMPLWDDVAIEHCNCRGELPLHLALKPVSVVEFSSLEHVLNNLWKARPSSVEVRDSPTQLYPFQLAACSEWGGKLHENPCQDGDNTEATSTQSVDVQWVNLVFTLLLAAPQAILFQQDTNS